MLQGVLKILPHGKVEKFFLQSRYSTKARQSKERVSSVTKLEKYTCIRLINHLTFSGFFQSKKIWIHCLVFTAII